MYSKSRTLFVAVVIAAMLLTRSALGHGEKLTSPLRIELPARQLPIPEPIPPGAQPGFKFRGIKGWAWTPDQYLAEIPWLAKFKMNFLMNCYVSLFASTHPWRNEWWKPLPDDKKAAFARVIRACRSNDITFCFCMNPQLGSQRPLDAASSRDVDQLFQHYAWAQSRGVRWFSLCVDDVGWGRRAPRDVAREDAKMVNVVLGRLRTNDSSAQMIFCPGPYWGDGTSPNDREYLNALGDELDSAVYIFWTGDAVTGRRITRAAAESYKNAVKHRLFLWDNYPVNDGNPALHLGPVNGRAPDLCEVIDGYMSNPMSPQNEANRIPLATCADYAYNPRAYDAMRSIGQTILLFASSASQREVLTELIETYPGFIATGGGTGANPVRQRFKELAAKSGPAVARAFTGKIETLSARLQQAFPDKFSDAEATIAADVAWMKAQK